MIPLERFPNFARWLVAELHERRRSMAKTKKRKHRKLDRSLPAMRPNAGGIDIGATEIFVAVPADLHNNKSYLGDYYRSQRARYGALKAIKNTAHKLARIFYHVVTTRQPYDETVFAKLEARNQERRFRKLQSLARQMGYSIVEATV